MISVETAYQQEKQNCYTLIVSQSKGKTLLWLYMLNLQVNFRFISLLRNNEKLYKPFIKQLYLKVATDAGD